MRQDEAWDAYEFSKRGFQVYVVEYVHSQPPEPGNSGSDPTLRLTLYRDGTIAEVAEQTDLTVLLDHVRDFWPEAKHLRSWQELPEYYRG